MHAFRTDGGDPLLVFFEGGMERAKRMAEETVRRISVAGLQCRTDVPIGSELSEPNRIARRIIGAVGMGQRHDADAQAQQDKRSNACSPNPRFRTEHRF